MTGQKICVPIRPSKPDCGFDQKRAANKANFLAGNAISEGRRTRLNATLGQIERGERPPAQRRKWRDLNENITVLKNELSCGERTLDEYWLSIGSVCAEMK